MGGNSVLNKTPAFILAGGQGKRMGVLCLHRSKPALPFAGGHRVIDFALSNCLHSRIGSIAVLTDYQRSYMASYLRRWNKWQTANRNLVVDILEANSHYLGTADAVYQNLGYLRKQGADTVLVLAADHAYKMDYRQMLMFHKLSKADVTVGAVPMPAEKARRFGTLAVGCDGRILDFAEKADSPQNDLVSMGIYVFNVKALTERLCEDARNPNSAHDFGYSIVPGMVKGGRAYAYQFNSYWRDIGTTESYYEASMELACQKSILSLSGAQPIITAPGQMIPPKVSPQGFVANSIVSAGCTVKVRVENSVLSPGVWVGENAVVRDSVLMGNVFIGRDSRVESSILDEGVSVGRSCSIGAKVCQPVVPEKITVIESGKVVPSGTHIGQDMTELLINEISECVTVMNNHELSQALTN